MRKIGPMLTPPLMEFSINIVIVLFTCFFKFNARIFEVYEIFKEFIYKVCQFLEFTGAFEAILN